MPSWAAWRKSGSISSEWVKKKIIALPFQDPGWSFPSADVKPTGFRQKWIFFCQWKEKHSDVITNVVKMKAGVGVGSGSGVGVIKNKSFQTLSSALAEIYFLATKLDFRHLQSTFFVLSWTLWEKNTSHTTLPFFLDWTFLKGLSQPLYLYFCSL